MQIWVFRFSPTKGLLVASNANGYLSFWQCAHQLGKLISWDEMVIPFLCYLIISKTRSEESPIWERKKKNPLKYVWSFHRCPAKDSLFGNGAGQVKYCESSVFDGWLNNISPVALKKMYGSLEIINKIMSSYSALNVMILFCVVCWGRSAWDTKAAILHVKTPACNVINNRIYD